MADPKVVAVMLIADRKELGERAVACFRAQTYQNKRLVILDTGEEPFRDRLQTGLGEYWWWEQPLGRSIGELRNRSAERAVYVNADIIVHWDSDDWSHPRRIEEQVALLKNGSAGCVGYSDMLFWREDQFRTAAIPVCGPEIVPGAYHIPAPKTGQAWLWRGAQNRPIGTSLCYWRRIWEGHRFARLPIGDSVGEDVDFVRRVESFAFSSVVTLGNGKPVIATSKEPRMVARIHAGNTSTGYGQIESSSSWKREPAFDDFCRKVMA